MLPLSVCFDVDPRRFTNYNQPASGATSSHPVEGTQRPDGRPENAAPELDAQVQGLHEALREEVRNTRAWMASLEKCL